MYRSDHKSDIEDVHRKPNKELNWTESGYSKLNVNGIILIMTVAVSEYNLLKFKPSVY